MSRSRERDPTAKYFSAVAALHCIAPLDPTLRARMRLARGFARTLLPSNTGPLRYAFEELLGETTDAARRLLYDWFFYRQLESRSWTGTAMVAAVGSSMRGCRRVLRGVFARNRRRDDPPG